MALSKMPTNADEMRKSVIAEYQRMVDGVITPEQAKASSNLSGKVLGLAKLEIEARRVAGRDTMIPFVNVKYEEMGE